MIKLVAAVYICLVVTVLTTTAVFARLMNGGEERIAPNVELNFRGGVKLAIAQVRETDDRPALLRKLSDVFGYPVELIKHPLGGVSDAARKRIAEGADLVWYPSMNGSFLVAPLTAAEALRFGPLPGSQTPKPSQSTIAFSAAAAALGLATLLLSWPVGRHLQRFEAAAQRLAQGDYSARMTLGGPFLRQAGRAFNHMAQRTQSLVQAQRELLRAVSHELRTPLSRLRFQMERIGIAAEAERAAIVQECDEELDGIDRLVDELLTFTRLDAPEVNPDLAELNPLDVIDGLAAKLRDQHSNIVWHVHGESDQHRLHVDVAMFQRALRNLMENAARHATSQVRVAISSQGADLIVDVEDDGPGIPSADRLRVFQPFVRLPTHSDGRPDSGVGLGLAIVKSIVTAHGAQVMALDAPGGGCRMRTVWPASGAKAL